MQVRAMTDADIEPVIGLWTRCGLTRPWNDPHRDIAFARGKPNSDVLVGETQERLVAAVMVGHDGHRGTLYYLAVDPPERGANLGRDLVHAAEQWLAARGVWKVNILIRSENAAVEGFYRSLGYQPNDVTSMGRWLTQESTARPDNPSSPPSGDVD
jgi:hypothetical protein